MYFEVIGKIDQQFNKTVSLVSENDIKLCGCISEANVKLINTMIEEQKFTGKKNERLEVSFFENNILVNMLYLGVGKKEEFSKNVLREVLNKALKGLKGDVLIYSEDKSLEDIDVFAEMAEHVNYYFDKYLSKKKDEKFSLKYFTEEGDLGIIEGNELAKISTIVKDLINEPAAYMTPEKLADQATQYGKEFGFEVEVFDEVRAKELKMESFLAVAQASVNRPRVIVMRYFGDKENKEVIGLVGKGLTYDTGGLSIKPTDGMLTMKCDMGGSATVIGTMCAISKMQVKKNVIAVVATCENSIGSKSYRPGDVIGSMNGKTVEITNTDAEGRLTLADAITYIIREEKVDEVIDVATLTGAILIALGDDTTGMFSNSDEASEKILNASKNWRDNMWRMPVTEEHGEMIKSSIADLQNSAGRLAGSSTAAKYLEEFVEGKKWIHLDIAGTAFADKADSYYNKGAKGQVFRTLYSYIKD